ncbi:MAG: IS66 family insertion sequence element accessory protein TnpA [Methylocella sp.]
MASKHFENKARRAWWSVHIEAWRRSGLSLAKYCVQHGLDPRTFGRWIGAIGTAKSLHYKGQPKRRRGASR